jgi:hypothetical protein
VAEDLEVREARLDRDELPSPNQSTCGNNSKHISQMKEKDWMGRGAEERDGEYRGGVKEGEGGRG